MEVSIANQLFCITEQLVSLYHISIQCMKIIFYVYFKEILEYFV